MRLAFYPLFLLVLANLLAHTFWNLDQLLVPAMFVGVGQEAIAIKRVRMKEHGTSQVRNLKRLEELVPSSKPIPSCMIEDQGRVVATCRSLFGGENLSGPFVLDGSALFVLSNPVVATVLFVCEDGGGSAFTQPCCNS